MMVEGPVIPKIEGRMVSKCFGFNKAFETKIRGSGDCNCVLDRDKSTIYQITYDLGRVGRSVISFSYGGRGVHVDSCDRV